MSTTTTQYKILIGGELADAASGETMEVIAPATGETIAEVPRCGAEDVDRAVEAAQAAAPEWLGRRRRSARAPPLTRRRDGGARRGARAARVGQRRQAAHGLARRDAVLGRQPPLLRRRRPQPRGQVDRRVHRGLHVDDPARADRDRRRHLPLELPADDGRLEDGAGARGGQPPDPEAVGADAALAAPLRPARAGGHPAGRAPGRHRRRRPGRAADRRASRRSGWSPSPATSRPARRSPARRPTRSSASTSSSAARRRW